MTLANISTLVRLLTNTTTGTLSNANLLILANNSYERLAGKLIGELMYSGWTFGDSNYTSLPTGTGNLTNDTRDYQLMGDLKASGATGFDTSTPLLTVRGVSVADENGDFHTLQQITNREIRERWGVDPEEFMTTNGRPHYYVLKEDFVQLYPKPDNGVSVTLTNGLKIDFDRRIELFTDMTSTTEVPGIPPQAHEIIAYEAAHTYAIAKQLPNVNLIKASLNEKEELFFDFMSRRNADNEDSLTGHISNYR